jgi:hypothetical protein
VIESLSHVVRAYYNNTSIGKPFGFKSSKWCRNMPGEKGDLGVVVPSILMEWFNEQSLKGSISFDIICSVP